MVGWITHK